MQYNGSLGKYSYLRMPMGVSCAPSMFQLIMIETLRGLEVLVYIDDVLIIQRESQSTADHLLQVNKFWKDYNQQASKPT